MQEITQGLSEIYNSSGFDVLTILLTGVGVAYSARFLNHLFGAKSRKVTATVAATLAFVAPILQALITYLQGHQFSNNVVPHAAEILTVATLAYNFFIKDGRFDQFLLKVEQVQNQSGAKVGGVVTSPTIAPNAPVATSASNSEFDVQV